MTRRTTVVFPTPGGPVRSRMCVELNVGRFPRKVSE
jgi:hypothetical protein